MATIQTAIDNYTLSIDQAINGDRLAISRKNARRKELINLMHQLSYYVLFTAFGDKDIAIQSGFDVARDREAVYIENPKNFKIVNGGNQGTLILSVKAVKGAKSYLYQYTTDENLNDDSWQTITRSTCKGYIKGLKSGTKYYCRIGVVGTGDQLMYSNVVSSYVL
jgi:hypothetical protein